MTERWTEERLDLLAAKVDALVDSIERLVRALYLEVPTLKAELYSTFEETRETRSVLHAELVEIKEVARVQSHIAEDQAATARIQSDNIRALIEMVNRRQA